MATSFKFRGKVYTFIKKKKGWRYYRSETGELLRCKGLKLEILTKV